MTTTLSLPDSALISSLDSPHKATNPWYNTPYASFSGADIVVTATIAAGSPQGETLVLGELQTLSYSSHRENRPVRALGHVSPVGFVRGPRTYAGTMIWTNFNHYGWYRLSEWKNHINKGYYPVADMLPGLDITVTFANEFGRISGLRILGVVITDEGFTMSVDDLILESTVNYMAKNVIPLIALR